VSQIYETANIGLITWYTFQAGINLGLGVALRGNLLFHDPRLTVEHTT
jgi:hypothetical protein